MKALEEWRIIPSFPDYEASNFGRIRRRTRAPHTRPGRILKTPPNRSGYLKAALSINNKMKHTTVHRLVAEAFLGPRPLGMVINHKNLVKSNNQPENLEYVTRQENEKHAQINGHKADSWRPLLSKMSPSRKISADDVREIRQLAKTGIPRRMLGQKFGISQSQIGRIIHRKRWGWVA